MADLRHYVISRLAWDPSRQTDQVIDEFLNHHYGRSAPPIRQFLNLVHDHYERAGTHSASAIYGHWEVPVNEEVPLAGLRLFEEAKRLADNDAIRARIEKASLCVYRAVPNPVWRLEEGSEIEPDLAAEMRQVASWFFALCDRYGAAGRASAQRERLTGLLGGVDGPHP